MTASMPRSSPLWSASNDVSAASSPTLKGSPSASNSSGRSTSGFQRPGPPLDQRPQRGVTPGLPSIRHKPCTRRILPSSIAPITSSCAYSGLPAHASTICRIVACSDRAVQTGLHELHDRLVADPL